MARNFSLLFLVAAARALLFPTAPTIQPALPTNVARPRAGTITARAQAQKLATNMKGAPVWDLRVAGEGDAASISALSEGLYPEAVVSQLVGAGDCVVGESGGNVVSAALAHSTGTGAKGATARADLLAVLEVAGLPEEVRLKTGLGVLKKLKMGGVTEARCAVAADDKKNLAFAAALGFAPTPGGAAKADKKEKVLASFQANLLAMNPDPQKRIKD